LPYMNIIMTLHGLVLVGRRNRRGGPERGENTFESQRLIKKIKSEHNLTQQVAIARYKYNNDIAPPCSGGERQSVRGSEERGVGESDLGLTRVKPG